MLYDKSHSKTPTTITPLSILLQIIFGFTSKKIGKIEGFSIKIGENRNRLKIIIGINRNWTPCSCGKTIFAAVVALVRVT